MQANLVAIVFSKMLFDYFCAYYGSVVQWIVFQIPILKMQVRFLPGSLGLHTGHAFSHRLQQLDFVSAMHSLSEHPSYLQLMIRIWLVAKAYLAADKIYAHCFI